MHKLAKKFFVVLLVCSFIASLSITAVAKPYNCPWCGVGGGYQTYMQVTNVTYIGERPCRLGYSHIDKLYLLNRTFHEYCSACGEYQTASYDAYCYCCPWDNTPQVQPPPNWELEY